MTSMELSLLIQLFFGLIRKRNLHLWTEIGFLGLHLRLLELPQRLLASAHHNLDSRPLRILLDRSLADRGHAHPLGAAVFRRCFGFLFLFLLLPRGLLQLERTRLRQPFKYVFAVPLVLHILFLDNLLRFQFDLCAIVEVDAVVERLFRRAFRESRVTRVLTLA